MTDRFAISFSESAPAHSLAFEVDVQKAESAKMTAQLSTDISRTRSVLCFY